MWEILLWNNRRIIGEVVALMALAFAGWWFVFHNTAKIAELEQDKAELSRQVVAGQQAITLLNKINQNGENIDRATFTHISSITATAVPRHRVLINAGVPLSGRVP